MTTVGILGGTGPAGRGVAVRLASGGYDVILGSRDAARAHALAGQLKPAGAGVIRGAANADAANAELVVVATPWDSAVATVRALRVPLANKIVISMVNALTREGKELVPLVPARSSMAAQLAFALPDSTVVGAFHHLPASEMEDLGSGLDADVVMFSDDPTSLERVAEMVNRAPGLRAVTAGSMSLAGAIESFTAVCVSINIRHAAHCYVKMAGLAG